MKNWSTKADIRTQLEKNWLNGHFLIPEDPECSDLFPVSIKLKTPTAAELNNDFASCQQWAQQFMDTALYTIHYKEINHSRLGKNQIPVAASFESMQAILVFLGKQDDHRLFHQLSTQLMSAFSMLGIWLSRYPFKALAHHNSWTALISVSQWMIAHPRPDIYTRQIPIPEIDTKFIEQHKKLLAEWWDILLYDEDVDCQAKGLKQFEKRYGFKSKPPLIRFRILDSELVIAGLSDLTITVEEFSKLQINVETIFVTENDINGLVFPDYPKAIVLFGRGYGFDYLQQVQWLKDKDIYYWGDIDTHGFAILSQFRQHLPQTKSFLMDESTLLAHKRQWVQEKKPTVADLPCLSRNELNLYNILRDYQYGENIRLEQEFVQYRSLKKALKET